MPVFATNLIAVALTVIARLRERSPKGQGLVEYALILFFLSIMVILALQFLQPAISTTLNNVTNSM